MTYFLSICRRRRRVKRRRRRGRRRRGKGPEGEPHHG
jgi:hypothetical protein